MPLYRVYEVQEEIRYAQWVYEVEADSPEAAILAARDTDPTEDYGYMGEPFYADNGFCAKPAEEVTTYEHEAACWSDAAYNIGEN